MQAKVITADFFPAEVIAKQATTVEAAVAAAPKSANAIPEVTESAFQAEVIEASHRGPVVVKFHAPW